MAVVLGSCLGLLLSRGALAPAEVKDRVPLADSVCWLVQPVCAVESRQVDGQDVATFRSFQKGTSGLMFSPHLRRQSRRSVRLEPSYRRATPPRASIRSRLTAPAVRVGSERRGYVLILEGSSERSLAEKTKSDDNAANARERGRHPFELRQGESPGFRGGAARRPRV